MTIDVIKAEAEKLRDKIDARTTAKATAAEAKLEAEEKWSEYSTAKDAKDQAYAAFTTADAEHDAAVNDFRTFLQGVIDAE